jgi:hypothetical protein
MSVTVRRPDAGDRSIVEQFFSSVFDLNNHTIQWNRSASGDHKRVELEPEARSLADEPKTDAFCQRHMSIQLQASGQQLLGPLLHRCNQNGTEYISALCMERRDEVL